jgi:hypothetical protein
MRELVEVDEHLRANAEISMIVLKVSMGAGGGCFRRRQSAPDAETL